MRNVVIWGKKFVPYINNDTISEAVRRSAAEINAYYKEASEDNPPLFVSILNGAFMYTSDLMKELNFPCELTFIKVSSYKGESSTGKVMEVIGLNQSVEGRDIILMDDIVDSGLTMKSLYNEFSRLGARSIQIASFIYKSHTCDSAVKVDFPCITMTDTAFTIGYGLDFNGLGRNLKDIYILEE
ncbi:MAG: phosphoribosyltransferase family protein [Rikenellaceae bacterium]